MNQWMMIRKRAQHGLRLKLMLRPAVAAVVVVVVVQVDKDAAFQAVAVEVNGAAQDQAAAEDKN
jgi:hypothetical protein